jgi:hypothetical protein
MASTAEQQQHDAAAALAAALGLSGGGSCSASPLPRAVRALPLWARWRIARDALAVASGVRALASFDGAHVPDPEPLARCLAPAVAAAAAEAEEEATGAPPLALLVVDGVCCVCAPRRLLRECAARLEALKRNSGGEQEELEQEEEQQQQEEGEGLSPPPPPPLLVCLDGGEPRLAPPDVRARVVAQLEGLQSALHLAFRPHCGAAAPAADAAPPPLPVAVLPLGSDAGASSSPPLPTLPTINGWLLGYPVVYVVGAGEPAGGEKEEEQEDGDAGRRAVASLQQASDGGGGLTLLRAVLPCASLPAEPPGPLGPTAPDPLWQCSVPVRAIGGERAVERLARRAERDLRAAADGGRSPLLWGPEGAARVEVAAAALGVAIVL